MIYFLKVADNQSKLQKLCKTVLDLFNQKKRVVITAPSPEAALFLNNMLWKYPEDSFLPHIYSDMPSKESIVITTDKEHDNKATVQVNLCAEARSDYRKFEKVYELYDETTEEKAKLSSERLEWYEKQGANIVVL